MDDSALMRRAALVLATAVLLIAAYGSGLTPGWQVRLDPHARVVERVALTVKEPYYGPTHALSRLHPQPACRH